MKSLLTLLLVALSIAYPLFVYYWIQELSAAYFGIILAGLASLKFILSKNKNSKQEIAIFILSLGCALLILIVGKHYLIKLYPVLISCSVGSFFAASLFTQETFIEHIARLRGKILSVYAINYARKLTFIWAVTLYLNALTALYLAFFASTQAWALYCGLISYIILGCLFAGEIIYRRFAIAKYESITKNNLQRQFDGNDWPIINALEKHDAGYNMQLNIQPHISWLEGHFPQQPILAGVVQTHWAAKFSAFLFSVEDNLIQIDNLKFQDVILPNLHVTLSLDYNAEKQSIKFRYFHTQENNVQLFSEGKISFGRGDTR